MFGANGHSLDLFNGRVGVHVQSNQPWHEMSRRKPVEHHRSPFLLPVVARIHNALTTHVSVIKLSLTGEVICLCRPKHSKGDSVTGLEKSPLHTCSLSQECSGTFPAWGHEERGPKSQKICPSGSPPEDLVTFPEHSRYVNESRKISRELLSFGYIILHQLGYMNIKYEEMRNVVFGCRQHGPS